MIAKIAVSAATFAIDKPYSYVLPQGLCLEPGIRVRVPFGRGNRPCEGVVLSVEEGPEEGLKEITQALDQEPVLSQEFLRLAAFIRERTFCTFFEAIRAMLPAGLWFRTRQQLKLTEDRSWKEQKLRQKDALRLLEELEASGGTGDGEILQTMMDPEAFRKATEYLVRKKWITADQDFLRRTGDKTEKIATLAVSAEEAMAYAAGRPRSALLQKSILELLCAVGSASVKDICYYTGCKAPSVKRLEELGFLKLTDQEVLRCSQIRPAELQGPLVLTEGQQAAYQGLLDRMNQPEPGTALLYGVTGSGKTSVYIRLIEACLEQGKQAVLLVPEIALTPQLLGLMAAYFGQTVAVLHSSLAATERYDQWKRVRSGEARVVVGTRSAVFAPCPQLGLLILDEEQEHSYQSENSPRYHAREVAQWRGLKENALVLLGSATPSIETMYHARTGAYGLYTLSGRYNGRSLPQVQIVDLRQEVKLGNEFSLSYPLQDALRQTADGGHQTILFLNRRGNSRALMCVDCGQAPQCPRCSNNLTYHSANGRLMCHYCGFSMAAPGRCPDCGGPMKSVGTGTQRVQQELLTLDPDLQVDRMDADTVSAANTHEQILRRFQEEKIPVLVGTQMVAKGLNLPEVTLVGVLDADLGLFNGGYRSAETTFNMLTQVVGRAGRGENPGCAVIQTMMPEHKIIQLAANQDYEGFYQLELELRRVQQLPPFGDLVYVHFSAEDEEQLLRGAVKFRQSLEQCMTQPPYTAEWCRVLGPAPCPVVKVNYRYRYRLTVNCRLTRPLRQLLAHLLRQFAKDPMNRGTGVYVDVNGYD